MAEQRLEELHGPDGTPGAGGLAGAALRHPHSGPVRRGDRLYKFVDTDSQANQSE